MADFPQPVRTAVMAITGTARREHGPLRSEQGEVGAGRERARSNVHHVCVRDVAVGEDDLVDRTRPAQRLELRLVHDGNSVGIEPARQRRRIAPAGNARDLRRREGDDLGGGIVAINDIEIVEVPAGRADDDDASTRRLPDCRGDGRLSMLTGEAIARRGTRVEVSGAGTVASPTTLRAC